MPYHTRYPVPQIHSTALWRNKVVGILGGSFNPAHAGHVHISKQALANLPIDCLWWSFTPGNPFKKKIALPSVKERIEAARPLIDDPRIILSDIEEQLGIFRTHELCQALNVHFPDTTFIWIGGMDLSEQFHHWENWKDVLNAMPVVFFKRPPFKGTLKRIPLRLYKNCKHAYFLPKSPNLYQKNTVFWALQGPTRKISSSEIREKSKIRV